MAQQTAVDVLWENLTSLFFFTDGIPIEAMEIYDKAKEIHEKQIIDAYESAWEISYDQTGEEYYNEIYGKQ